MAAETCIAPKFRGAPASDQAPGKQMEAGYPRWQSCACKSCPSGSYAAYAVCVGSTRVLYLSDREDGSRELCSSLIAKAKPLPGSHTTRIAGGRTSRSTSNNSKTDRKGKHIQVLSSSRRNPRLCGCLWLPYFEYMLRSLHIPRAGRGELW